MFAGALGYRYLTLQLTNDDYMFIAIGRQIAAFGEWPVIDVFERGDPLHKVASAAAQAVAGYRLAGEVTLDLLVLSGAAVLTFIVAAEVARSPAIGFVMAVIAILATPRLYAYPKVALPVVALWLCFRYLNRRTTGAVVSLGAITAFAFLFRHDLGAFIGVLCVSAILLAQIQSRSRPMTEAFTFIVPIVAIAGSYLVLVELHGGVGSYFQSARRFVERDISRSDDDPPPAFTFDRLSPLWERNPAVPVKIRWAPHVADEARVALERRYALRSGRPDQGRTWTYMLHDTGTDNLLAILAEAGIEDTDNIDRTLPRTAGTLTLWERIGRRLRAPPTLAIAPGILNRSNAVAWLYYLLHALPYLASIVFIVLAIRGAGAAEARIVPAIVYCMVATPFLVRGNLYENARLSDVMTLSVVLGAWLASIAFRPRASTADRGAWVVGSLAAVVVALTLGSVTVYASVGRRIENLPFLAGRGSAVAHVRSLTTDLLSSPPPLTWLSPQTGAHGAVTYLRSCIAPGDRFFVYGFYPELFFFSGRGSAGNPPIHLPGLWQTPAEQRRTVDALSRRRVPIALIDATPAGGFSRDQLFPVTHPIVHQHLLANFDRIGITDFGGSTDVRYEVWAHKGWAALQTPQWSPLPCAPQ